MAILRSDTLSRTVVTVLEPRDGEYVVEPLDGSPAIKDVTEGTEPPKARVKAHGRRRAARSGRSSTTSRRGPASR